MSSILNLADVLGAKAEELGSQVFLRSGDLLSSPAEISYAEMDELVGQVALAAGGGLATGGRSQRRAPRIMTIGGDAIDQAAVWLACQRLGAVWAPLNSLLSGAALDQVLAMAQPDLIVSPRDLSIATEHPEPVRFSQLVQDGSGGGLSNPEHMPQPDDQAKLMFTSGTTGDPKGVVWSRRCEAMWAESYANELLDVSTGSSLFTCLPLAHVTAQGTVMAALLRGATLAVAPEFLPFVFWDQIRAVQATRFTYVGTILATLARRRPLASDRQHPVDRIVGAGAPVAQWRQIEERFGVTIVETWGQTESAGCYSRPDSLPQRPGSVGVVPDRFEVAFDRDDEPIADPAVVGELLIRPTEGGAIFDGYLLADGSIESPYDDEGWYHTGDRMKLADDGHLEFVVRQRESIRRRGEIIAATPIEDAALQHAAISEAAVIAVRSDDGVDEEIKLCAVADGPPPEPAELHRFLRDRLPRFMVPRYIQFLDGLPKTGSTRIQKFKLDAGTTSAWDARHRRRRQEPEKDHDPSQLR